MGNDVKIQLIVCLWLMSVFAWTQTEHGTIVVAFGLSDGYIAVAADSMALVGDDNPRSVCKVATINDKLVVAASGTTGHIANNGNWDFSVLATATEVAAIFSAGKSALNDFASLFTNAWATKVVDKFNHELKVRPKETTASSQGNLLADGIVVGLDQNGILGIWVIEWHYNSLANGRKTAFLTIEHRNGWPVYLALGDASIANEVFWGTTERGRQWKQNSKAVFAGLPASQQNDYMARELVDLTISHLPPKVVGVRLVSTVGGHVDSITIDKTGRIEWRDHKPECR
jgi:hypothetical protein